MPMTCALIGCGAISGKHLTAVAENRDTVRLVAVCDVDRSRAEALVASDRSGVSAGARIYTDHRLMLNEVKPDVVAIATPTRFHYGIAVDCMQAGAHVIVEKPMALSTSEADSMIETARRNRVKLSVCYITRFAPHIKLLKRMIDEGRFGKLYYGALQIRWNRSEQYYKEAAWRGTWEADGGMLMNQGTHGLDLLTWLVGSPLVRTSGLIRRFARPIEAEDFTSATLEFASGAVGLLEASVLVYPKNLESSLSLFGETGTVVIGGNHIDTIKTWNFADAGELSTLEGAEAWLVQAREGQKSGHGALYEDVFRAITSRTEPSIDGPEGRRSIEAVLSVYRASRDQTPISFPVEFSTIEMKDTACSSK